VNSKQVDELFVEKSVWVICNVERECRLTMYLPVQSARERRIACERWSP
jgi:hypothetical protein